jgi:hypothetical protein
MRAPKPIAYNGRVMLTREWAVHTGIPHQTIAKRIRSGWPVAEALGYEPHVKIEVSRVRDRQCRGKAKPIFGMSPEAAALLGLISDNEYLERYS